MPQTMPAYRRPAHDLKVVALCGGVGGAKLALGLDRLLAPGALTVVVNTGDDFRHMGLHISPDVDTVLYTLAGLNNPETGWGRKDETWRFMETLADLGGETWFKLGDKDLAIHVERTRRLDAGEPLSAVIDGFRRRLGIASAILPMSDDPVATVVETADGPMAFQHYFVREQCRPAVTGFRFEGAAAARPLPAVIEALKDPDLGAVVVCPSNPFVSVDPILAVPGIRAALIDAAAPVIAVSPIVGGRAIKGPAAKMMTELGLAATPAAVAAHYARIVDGFVLDATDADQRNLIFAPTVAVPSVMRTLEDRVALARAVLSFADGLHVQRLAS